MDAEGARICVEAVTQKDPGLTKVVFVTDGDVHEPRWQGVPAAAQWICGKCGCHKGKNIPRAFKGGSMSGLTCRCRDNPNSNACTSMPGYRWKDDWGHRIMAQYYDVTDRGIAMFLPESLHPGMAMPSDIGSPARESARQAAIAWCQDEIIGIYYHITGECKPGICKHAPLSPDHPALRCGVQKEYLWKVLKGLAAAMPDILTPFGRVDINAVESLNALVARWRKKGKWGAIQCF